METNLFFGCTTSDEVRNRYDELARVFNPTKKSESNEMMITINDQYDKLMKVLDESHSVEAVKEKDFQIYGSISCFAANNLFIFNKKYNIFEKKLYIPQLKERFENKLVFTTKDILSFYRETEPAIPSSTVNWRVYSLVYLGVLLRIGKGKFKLGKGSLYIPEVDNRIIKISKSIKEKFPFIQYCIWGSFSIIEFGHHIPRTNIILVDVDRDSTESVFHSLKEDNNDVFYRPGKDLLNNYINDLKKVVIVRPLVTEAPLQVIKNTPTITIEKLLVDALVDEEFEFLKGNEINRVFTNAFDRYSVNISKLIRYADRKRKKPDILLILRSNNLAADNDLLPQI